MNKAASDTEPLFQQWDRGFFIVAAIAALRSQDLVKIYFADMTFT